MKKQLILSCLLGMTSLCAIAQLEVDSVGKVIIGEDYTGSQPLYVKTFGILGPRFEGGKWSVEIVNNRETTNHTGLHVQSRPYYNAIGIEVQNSDDATKTNGMTVGVKSVSGGTPRPHYSIVGALKGTGSNEVTQDGIAIYGSTGNTVSYPYGYSGLYAGLFKGDVCVALGTLYASLLTPSANSSSAVAEMSNLSDRALALGESVSDKLSQVSLFQFHREPQTETASEAKAASSVISQGSDDDLTDEEQDVEDEYVPGTQLAAVQYGLAADQLREVYPELVYEDKNGNVSINYIEMIPLLVQANNELRARVAALEAEKETRVQQSKNMVAAQVPLPWEGMGESLLLSLGQNNPNPFSEQTSIEVSVPETVATAALLIFDMQGKQARKIDIDVRGTSRITVTGQGLTEGMYLYSLIADGKVVQTRKMILSK